MPFYFYLNAEVCSLQELTEQEAQAVETAAEGEKDRGHPEGKLCHGEAPRVEAAATRAAAVVVHQKSHEAGEAQSQAQHRQADYPVAGKGLFVI